MSLFSSFTAFKPTAAISEIIFAAKSDVGTILSRLSSILGKMKQKSIIDNGISTCYDTYCDTYTIRELRSLYVPLTSLTVQDPISNIENSSIQGNRYLGTSTVTVKYFKPHAKNQTAQFAISYLCSLPSSVSSLHSQVVMSLLLPVQRLGCVKDAGRRVYRKPVSIDAEYNLAVGAMIGIFNCQLQHGSDRDAQIRNMRVMCSKTCKNRSVNV